MPFKLFYFRYDVIKRHFNFLQIRNFFELATSLLQTVTLMLIVIVEKHFGFAVQVKCVTIKAKKKSYNTYVYLTILIYHTQKWHLIHFLHIRHV